MKIQVHKSLRIYLDEAIYQARPRRNRSGRSRKVVLANILAKAEAAGDATRYIDQSGRTAWKATPQLREHLADLQTDAEADAEAEAM